MRRVVAIIGLVGVVALLFFGLGSGGTGGSYEVRGIFDNGGFLVPGEEVRIAGARVGSVASTDVTRPGEWVNRDHSPDPGKAAVVLKIDDSGFQDFRQDASCLIRPQSLLGEKYVDCQPTQPRAPGSQPPPPLDVIPDGQPGAGERFLPLENNGKEVDLDLINNIMREPYADRFRLILNDLGAGLAARGPELQAIVARADPALRQTDRVLAELARQNHELSRLAVNGDTDLAPLVRERQHLSGFINNANTAAQATAERSKALEAGFQRFPDALRQLRLTMAKLRGFSDQATPVFADFRAGAPAIARATRALGPFAHAATPSLITLGTASQQSKQPIVNSDPILRNIRDLAKKSAPGAKVLARLLASLRESGFYKQLTSFLFYTTGGVNGYDQYGHFLRAVLEVTGCTTLITVFDSTCGAQFGSRSGATSSTMSPSLVRTYLDQLRKQGSVSPSESQKYLDQLGWQATSASGQPGGSQPPSTGQPLDAQGQPAGGAPTTQQSAPGTLPRRPSFGAARALLDTVIGRQRPAGQGGRP
jgi:phospholipid/cholesterol/gamma-HCH transport system substrate-binding protein